MEFFLPEAVASMINRTGDAYDNCAGHDADKYGAAIASEHPRSAQREGRINVIV
jgi:hypothetical protein